MLQTTKTKDQSPLHLLYSIVYRGTYCAYRLYRLTEEILFLGPMAVDE